MLGANQGSLRRRQFPGRKDNTTIRLTVAEEFQAEGPAGTKAQR